MSFSPSSRDETSLQLIHRVFMYLCFYAGIQFIEIKTMATASQWKQKTEKHQLPELRMHVIINKEPTTKSQYLQKLKKGD